MWVMIEILYTLNNKRMGNNQGSESQKKTPTIKSKQILKM